MDFQPAFFDKKRWPPSLPSDFSGLLGASRRQFEMMKLLVLLFLPLATAFTAAPLAPRPMRAATATAAATPMMLADPTSVIDTTNLLALGLPIPAFTPAKVRQLALDHCMTVSDASSKRPSFLHREETPLYS